MSSFLHFLKAALREPLQVSTIFQTTQRTAQVLCEPLQKNSEASVLELGVGAGAVTGVVDQWISKKEKYLGFEINPDLIAYVRESYPQFKFVRDSAENIRRHTGTDQKFDLIVSTLPWTLLPNDVRKNILEVIREVLSPQGEFRTYVVSNAIWTPPAKNFLELLHGHFDVETEWQWLNAPPAKIFKARIPEASKTKNSEASEVNSLHPH